MDAGHFIIPYFGRMGSDSGAILDERGRASHSSVFGCVLVINITATRSLWRLSTSAVDELLLPLELYFPCPLI